MSNKTRFAIKMTAMLLVSVAICVVNTDPCYRWLSMQVCSPQNYYHDVAGRQMRQWTTAVEKIYNPLLEKLVGNGEPRRITCKAELGDTLKALYGNLRLDSISLIADGERDGEEVLGQIALQINDQNALHASGYLNYGEQYGHVQIPELSEARLTLTQLLRQELDEGSQGDKYLFSLLGNAGKYLPPAEEVSILLAEYPYLLLGQETAVTRRQKQVQAGGISKKSTQYTAIYTGETCYQICQDLLDNLEQDAVDFLREKLEAHKEQFLAEQSGAVVEISVDSVGNTIGCSVNMNIGGKTLNLSYLILRKGMDIGCEWIINVNDIIYLDIYGNASVCGEKLSGDFNICLDESLNPYSNKNQTTDQILQVSIRDLDLLALMQKQEIRGEVEMFTEQIPALQYYRLRIGLDYAGGQSNNTVQIMTGKNVFATINLRLEEGEHPDVGKRKDYDGTKNSYCLSDLGELANYASEIDLDQILEKIEQDCGVNLGFLREML